MNPERVATYLQYGIPREMADLFVSYGLSVSALRGLSVSELVGRYGIDEHRAEFVKSAVIRQPIDAEVLNALLEASNHTCCCCKGTKGQSYLIHHIEEYSVSQDNSYNNLAVLCPTCHDLAHRASGLTQRLTPKQIRRRKREWEVQVAKQNKVAAARRFEIQDTDYVNIPRILELCEQVQRRIPHIDVQGVSLSAYLRDIEADLSIIQSGIAIMDMPFAPRVRFRVENAFRAIVPHLEFQNVDELLSLRRVRSPGFIGTLCVHVGGVYGQPPKRPFLPENVGRMHFRRRGFRVEWPINPMFITSGSAADRMSRCVSAIYGIVRNVEEAVEKEKKIVRIQVRPYIVGIPQNFLWSNRASIDHIWAGNSVAPGATRESEVTWDEDLDLPF